MESVMAIPQSAHSRTSRSRLVPLPLLILLLLGIGTISAFAFEDPPREPGLHDDAGVFNAQERSEIEQAIGQVEETGAPTVVYLRLLHTVSDRAIGDGQRLMEAWELESAPGARDGVVMFFNLEPDDPNRGEFGIVAGETHYDGGALPQSELDNIRDSMIDLLIEDRMADAIVLGLDMTAERIEAGPPEPTILARIFDRIARGPISLLNILSVSAAVLFAVLGVRRWRERPFVPHSQLDRTDSRPSELHPALAGALVQSKVDHTQIEATIIELAKHGAITFEPDPRKKKRIQIRILDPTIGANAFENSLLELLGKYATEQVLDQSALARTRNNWGHVQELIRDDLRHVGWFDRNISSKRTPLFLFGALALGLGALHFVPLSVIDEPWVLAGGGLLGLVGIGLIMTASRYPDTTIEGEKAAVPWRGYQDGLSRAAKQGYGTIDLDDAFPYIVAFGLPNRYKKHFKQASASGFVPSWLDDRHVHGQPMAGNWFVYWNAFHTSVTPSSSGSGAGGAAGGSGGSGGRF